MSTQYYTATSLDGFLADERNSLDWLLEFGDGSGGWYDDFIAKVGAVVMGATTYRWLLAHLDPTSARGEPWPYHQPTWVLSHTDLPRFDGADIRFAAGDVVPVHAAAAEAAGKLNIWIVGGGDVAGQFLDAALIDEIILAVAPVVLLAGARALPRRIVADPFELVTVDADGPFARLTYRVPE